MNNTVCFCFAFFSSSSIFLLSIVYLQIDPLVIFLVCMAHLIGYLFWVTLFCFARKCPKTMKWVQPENFKWIELERSKKWNERAPQPHQNVVLYVFSVLYVRLNCISADSFCYSHRFSLLVARCSDSNRANTINPSARTQRYHHGNTATTQKQKTNEKIKLKKNQHGAK